jgi:luciferase-type oxidoreductase
MIYQRSFELINQAYNTVYKPNEITLGIFHPIESYAGSIPLMENQIELSQLAESVGFSALWFRDVPLHSPEFGDAGQMYDPFVYMAFIAGYTNKIALATGSTVINFRHPIHLAKAAATVDRLTKGRLILGIASGDRPIEYPAFGVNINLKKETFQESLNYLKILNNDFPSYQSRLGTLDGNADLLPKAYNLKIPILITGFSGQQSLEWIAKNSDGWIFYPRNIEYQKRMIIEWRTILQNLSLQDKPFTQSLYIDFASDPNCYPTPIHLGFRLGRNYLLKILQQLREIGVNHVIINLKYSNRDIKSILNEIGDFIIPHINS